jgi:hypothetical protein
MAQVTYLLGAGASAGRLPIVNQMAEHLKSVIKEIEDFDYHNIESDRSSFGFLLKRDVLIKMVIDDLQDMRIACEQHSSIDTYAKKLFLTNQLKFKELKRILSFYFTYIQICGIPDKRYDNFWASILNEKDKLPSKIKILSWNYDFQLEQSYLNMSSSSVIDHASMALKVTGPGMIAHNFDLDSFGLVKLNGSARIMDGNKTASTYLCSLNSHKNFESHFSELIYTYGFLKNSPHINLGLNFAWENNFRLSLGTETTAFVQSTEVLAIIGYSFPFFNREIDKSLLDAMPKLKKVYIQDKYPEAIRERLFEFVDRNIDAVLVNDVNQFVFPRELDIS